jgi:putative transcriptional regulator
MPKKSVNAEAGIRLAIDQMLEKRGRSAYWLANELGIGHGNLYRYRKGQINAVNLKLLARMCALLECTPGDLVLLQEGNPTAKPRTRAKT